MYFDTNDLYVLGFLIFGLCCTIYAYRFQLKQTEKELWKLKDDYKELQVKYQKINDEQFKERLG